MNAIMNEHDLRGAVERLAAGAATPPIPAPAVLAAGARRRTRRRAGGAVGAVALAATLAVSVSWTAGSGGSGADPSVQAPAPTTTNAFTERLGHTLEQVLPGAKVSVGMFTDVDPLARHNRWDWFPVRITYRGRSSDAVLTFDIADWGPDPGGRLCTLTVPPIVSQSGCMDRDIPGGGMVHAEVNTTPAVWTRAGDQTREGASPLTVVVAEAFHGRTVATLDVRGGTRSNDSGLSPSMLGTALADPRFTAFLRDFTAHPEQDPYGPLAKVDTTRVASGTAGSHRWTLSFGITSNEKIDDYTRVMHNCDDWEYTFDGVPAEDRYGDGIECMLNSSTVDNPASTDEAVPSGTSQITIDDGLGGPRTVVGTTLKAKVIPGTVSVEATFDDQPAKLTAGVFTVHGDMTYFALVKPDPARPTWKLATVRCLDGRGRELGKLYFAPPP